MMPGGLFHLGHEPMTDAPATPQPRRRWKRWALVSVLVVLLVVWLRTTGIQLAELRRSEGIRLGQTRAEVMEIMGPDSLVRFHGGRTLIIRVGRVQHVRFAALMVFQNATGWQVPDIAWPRDDDWPIQIGFDEEERVDRIKRGSEIVER